MQVEKEIYHSEGFKNLDLLARQVVEGFISGMHKSPFHGFSAEFAEHKLYNQGESTRHIDWKLYARTDKLYTRRYEEETNLRCHFILDNSASMHFPKRKIQTRENLNKIGFSVLAIAGIMQILKRQRDAVGLSIYSDIYEFYAPEKGGERHRQMLLNELDAIIGANQRRKQTRTYTHLHLIAEKMKRRSLIFLFSDMFQDEVEEDRLFESLRHLKYNKHEVVLFHVMDRVKEVAFDFDNTPRRFTDTETGEGLNIYAENVREAYTKEIQHYIEALKMKCAQYRIKYVQAGIQEGFETVLLTYLIERQKF